MDILIPNLNGIEATRRFAASDGSLILITFDLDDYVYADVKAA